MTFRAFFLAFGLAIAAFGAISLAAPGEALAHAGHHAAPAAGQPPPSEGLDAVEAVADEAADQSADDRCFNACCVGSSCCPPTLAAQNDDFTQFPSAVKLIDPARSLKPDSEVEPLPEPPRSFV